MESGLITVVLVDGEVKGAFLDPEKARKAAQTHKVLRKMRDVAVLPYRRTPAVEVTIAEVVDYLKPEVVGFIARQATGEDYNSFPTLQQAVDYATMAAALNGVEYKVLQLTEVFNAEPIRDISGSIREHESATEVPPRDPAADDSGTDSRPSNDQSAGDCG
jgi:hypothetical protein